MRESPGSFQLDLIPLKKGEYELEVSLDGEKIQNGSLSFKASSCGLKSDLWASITSSDSGTVAISIQARDENDLQIRSEVKGFQAYYSDTDNQVAERSFFCFLLFS